jgi:hypothetical protein
VRNKAAASNPSVVAWLDKVVKPVLVSARKGGIAVADQQVRPQLKVHRDQAAGCGSVGAFFDT